MEAFVLALLIVLVALIGLAIVVAAISRRRYRQERFFRESTRLALQAKLEAEAASRAFLYDARTYIARRRIER